jgi:hypothetical protein
LIIVALLVLSIAAVGVFSVMLAARSKKEFAEQNEVVPGQKSPAPASWAGAHSREAKLHRRLGDAVRGARANPRFVELGLASQMNTIEAEALAIDERLVAAASLPRSHKEPAIDDLEAHVDELESTIAEMVTSVTVADSNCRHSPKPAPKSNSSIVEQRAPAPPPLRSSKQNRPRPCRHQSRAQQAAPARRSLAR